MGTAAGVGDGPATAAQLLYVVCYLYYELSPYCLLGIMWVWAWSWFKWVVAWKANMSCGKAKVG